jgi:hypothetical protein
VLAGRADSPLGTCAKPAASSLPIVAAFRLRHVVDPKTMSICINRDGPRAAEALGGLTVLGYGWRSVWRRQRRPGGLATGAERVAPLRVTRVAGGALRQESIP